MKPTILLSFLGLAAAVPPSSGLSRREDTSNDDPTRRLLIGGPDKILAADFDGSTFSVVGSASQSGAVFSWLLFREDPSVVYAVDEYSNKIHVYDYNPSGGKDEVFTAKGAELGTAGVVHLELNEAGTRMLASAYGSGVIQIWDTSAGNSINLIGNLTSGIPGNLTDGSQPHQAIRHPTLDFFVVNDIGTDTILIVDAQNDDDYKVTNFVSVQEGCGPRHGTFLLPEDGSEPAYYTVACEKSNELLTYELDYNSPSINFNFVHSISTFGSGKPPVGAAAGEIFISESDIYVSNRNTSEPEDSISRFRASDGELHFESEFSSKANNPRMMSISKDKKFIYVANTENSQGLHAFHRALDTGEIQPDLPAPHADLSEEFKDEPGTETQTGPQFVLEISASG